MRVLCINITTDNRKMKPLTARAEYKSRFHQAEMTIFPMNNMQYIEIRK